MISITQKDGNILINEGQLDLIVSAVQRFKDGEYSEREHYQIHSRTKGDIYIDTFNGDLFLVFSEKEN